MDLQKVKVNARRQNSLVGFQILKFQIHVDLKDEIVANLIIKCSLKFLGSSSN